MLVLTRKCGERIVFPDLGVEVTVLEVRGGQARLGITAPPDVGIYREEVWIRMRPCSVPGGSRGGGRASDRDEDGMAPVMA